MTDVSIALDYEGNSVAVPEKISLFAWWRDPGSYYAEGVEFYDDIENRVIIFRKMKWASFDITKLKEFVKNYRNYHAHGCAMAEWADEEPFRI